MTAALPYANGPIHIGHLVEYLQTDIWVRFQNLIGNRCLYVCADDAHGTPIMLRAQKEGVEPAELVARMLDEHQQDFRDFRVGFHNYHTTHSSENRALATLIYTRLRDAGHINKKVIKQAFDPVKEMFLPDRFIRGTCPRCKAEDQYGDSCEVCGATYSPSELIDPVSSLSGKAPVERESEHYFFQLGDFAEMLLEWTHRDVMQPQVRNKLKEWFDSGLRDWDISRDAPYWGFEIPDAPGKYFYVWLDAPIGYMASFRNYCDKTGTDFDAYFSPDSDAELYHFIGKDIAYFHTLFWPAMLSGAGFRTPTAVFCHGFLTVDGEKMSKSRGTFINARTYLDHLDPEYLRYYYAAKLGSSVDDIDLNLEDFCQRVNSDLVGKFVNIASRCAGILAKHFGGQLSEELPEPGLYEEFAAVRPEIARLFEGREFAKAVRRIMSLADRANQFIDEAKPWALVKADDTRARAQSVCTQGINLYRVLATLLSPVLPRVAEQSRELLDDELAWSGLDRPLLGRSIRPFKALIQRVDPDRVQAMVAATAGDAGSVSAGAAVSETNKKKAKKSGGSAPGDAARGVITIDDFDKVELRVAEIRDAQHVDGAEKLLQLTVTLGEETRTVFAGIKSAYPEPAKLIGRQVVLVANLKPRKMRFGTSEGMVLAAGPGGQDIFLLSPDSGATPGMRVK